MTNASERKAGFLPQTYVDEASEMILWELWESIAKELRSSQVAQKRVYGAALRAAERKFGVVDFCDPLEPTAESAGGADKVPVSDMPESIQYVHHPLMDYIRGIALSIDPFPRSSAVYTIASDAAAMASDWNIVRSDMIEGWAQLMEDNPQLAQTIAATRGEGADGGRRGSAQRKRTDA